MIRVLKGTHYDIIYARRETRRRNDGRSRRGVCAGTGLQLPDGQGYCPTSLVMLKSGTGARRSSLKRAGWIITGRKVIPYLPNTKQQREQK